MCPFSAFGLLRQKIRKGMQDMKIPNHVAIILDGNGRWAKSKGMPRTYGHTTGAKNVEKIAEAACNMGIRYLTLYAFSTENWNRPPEEVKALMNLLDSYLKNCIQTAKKNNMAVRVLGDISRLDDRMQEKIQKLEESSADYDGLHLQIAINYGSRDEIVRAIRKLGRDVEAGKIAPDQISEETFSSYLDTAGLPDPDLLIRTSGEERLSNFLLWQLAYTEIYVTDCLWPDFNQEELENAIRQYNKRDRRFGGVK